jgi:hydrogenase maturation protein HypF
LANELLLAGEVRNVNDGVEIVVEGGSAAIDNFVLRLRLEPPPLAQISEVQVFEADLSGRQGFEIGKTAAAGAPATAVPVDLAMCENCLADVRSASNRRAEYPFTSCTDCGPRYSILTSLPYERSATSMAAFQMCQACSEEYEQPVDRRFHAETIACPECGPRCWLSNCDGEMVAEGRHAVSAARSELRAGKIVALRGIGGYQLLADATNASAVARLRDRKQRQAKPLAVLVESLVQARDLAYVNAATELALNDPVGPIVVLPLRQNSRLPTSVCGGLSEVGLMLPTSPLHWLVAHDGPPLVATSGNVEGQPLEFQTQEATGALLDVADLLLHHDRPILRPIDDSVVKIIGGRAVTLRAGRGMAPLPLKITFGRRARDHHVLAVGGQQNSALAIFNGRQAVLGPHLGDLDEIATCERWHAHRRDFCELLCAEPSLIVHDLHPDYYTTRWAKESGLPTIGVQHHHAHLASAMLEHDWLEREVLGVAWDGTGYGPDATVWGGEFLCATVRGYQRVARSRPFSLPGGERAIREPWRIALALLTELSGPRRAMDFLAERGWQQKQLSAAEKIVSRPGLSPRTSSIGRLFDAVATIVLPFDVCHGGHSLYEAHLAMLLESTCDWSNGTSAQDGQAPPYPFPLIPGQPDELDWRPLIHAITDDLHRGVSSLVVALRFHAALASAIASVSDKFFNLPVVLCGGVFQNRVLTEMTLREFNCRSQELAVPGLIPPGDGGLAAGQLAVALAQLDQGCLTANK